MRDAAMVQHKPVLLSLANCECLQQKIQSTTCALKTTDKSEANYASKLQDGKKGKCCL